MSTSTMIEVTGAPPGSATTVMVVKMKEPENMLSSGPSCFEWCQLSNPGKAHIVLPAPLLEYGFCPINPRHIVWQLY